MSVEVPDEVLRHILRKHRDVVLWLKIRGVDELKRVIMDAVSRPGELYSDRYGVRYFLEKIDEQHWLNVVVQRSVVKTAYIIGLRTYERPRRRRLL